MPELAEEVNEAGEPSGDFGPNEIKRFATLKEKVVIANGCTLGELETARAFLDHILDQTIIQMEVLR
ncbi:hypothetical protein OB236_08695 [Paenibacillus sp. WQ 127069]|uniref:Uncharacterized protein n=1 Tax=Paenibacillus baimaensis TaxID=2982185 RepID=A0ABT2UC39_9BACL|nr:hypothetical protein [Paenibacillus sp. WQ 127069]MCU6792203.1 hypothetical protein [Paenibacillus sp. WQ 127069]